MIPPSSKPDLVQIAYEVTSLAAMVTDRSAIARHINAVHGTPYQASDIEKILLGIKPTASIPRQNPSKAKLLAEPIAWTPPISTNRGGEDLLAKATNEYLAKHRDRIVTTELAKIEARA